MASALRPTRLLGLLRRNSTALTVPDYKEIFYRRGQLYHRAMETYPTSRAEEFLSVIGEANIAPGMTVIDVPSGGAYLADYLPGVSLVGLESSPVFAALAKERAEAVLLFDDNNFPLASASVERVLSIAGLHHSEHKRGFFAEVRRVLKRDGRLVVADVAENSPVRRFLDEFVGKYNETGHSGWYFGATTRSELKDAGLDILRERELRFRWHAPDRSRLADFCRTLFGMVRTDNATVAAGLAEYLGFHEAPDRCGLNWELHCFVCEPAGEPGSIG